MGWIVRQNDGLKLEWGARTASQQFVPSGFGGNSEVARCSAEIRGVNRGLVYLKPANVLVGFTA
jgi:hypothetical protein